MVDLGGWRDEALSEDMELAANLANKGYSVKYASDVCCWQENPSSLGQFFSQRVRWFRGCMEASVQYGTLMKKPSFVKIDAEITLMGSFLIASGLIGYFLALMSYVFPFSFDSVFLTLVSSFLVSLLLIVVGLGLVFFSKPRKLGNLLWLPFIYCYWMLQTFIASYALFLIVFRRPKRWKKTDKNGKITSFETLD